MTRDRKEAEDRIAVELVAVFDASGVPYTCAAVVHNTVRERAAQLCQAANYNLRLPARPGQCERKAADLVHARWLISETVPQDLALCNRCRRVAGSYDGEYGPECRCRPV